MVPRVLEPHLREVSARYPVVTVTGPRQSGKSTLCRIAFPDKPYVSLETPSQRSFAMEDPLGFLAQFPNGAIFDEFQRVPDLPSYLQGLIDDDPAPGRYILTGSHHLALAHSVSQSLAGRAAFLNLLPMSRDEIESFPDHPRDRIESIWSGSYPRIFDRHLPPGEWLANYIASYVERDVRQIVNIGDLTAFQTFLRMCAGRSGQLLNLASLGSDCGISHTTAKSWISVLEASWIAFRLPPFHANLGKRLIKTPKLYFYDTGLLCSLLGISAPAQLVSHPLQGAVFENWVVTEVVKHLLHRGQSVPLTFFRDQHGHEVDLLVERVGRLAAVEVKSSSTPMASHFDGLASLRELLARNSHAANFEALIVYGGESQARSAGRFISWTDVARYDW